MKIGLCYDLRSDYLKLGYRQEDVAEFDSEETIDALEETLRLLGHETERVGNVFSLTEALATGRRWELVFNVCEGLRGRCREAQVPGLLEAYDIPYTASDPLVCAATLDKAVAKRLVRESGLATPRFAVVRSAADVEAVGLEYPLFAKPIAEGTGKGISRNSRIETAAQLRQVCGELLAKYEEPVLVEEFLPGREFTVGILGTGARARAIGTMEIFIPACDNGAIYSFEAKEQCEELCKYVHYAPGTVAAEVEELAVECHRALQCRDVSRVDIRCDGAGRPCFMEVNPLPGLHPSHSDLPMIATAQGVSYEELIGEIMQHAIERTAAARTAAA